MLTLPWYMAFGHLPTTSANYALGHNALASVSNAYVESSFGGRRALVSRLTTTGGFTVTLPTSTTYAIGFYYRTSWVTDPEVFDLRAGSTVRFRLALDTGKVKVYSDAGATLLGTGTATLSVDTWTYIEVAVTFHGSNASVLVHVNGVADIDVSGVAMAGTGVDTARWWRAGGSTGYAGWTNLYVRDEATLHGPIEMTRLNLDSDVAVDWDPDSGATNYTQVQLPAVATSYLDSDTLGDVDENGVGDLPAGVNSIIAVCRVSMAEAPDGGAPQIRHGLKRGTDEEYGTERSVGVGGPRTQLTVFGTQPNGDPWSVAAVDELVSLRKSA